MTAEHRLRIATRRSALARAQAFQVGLSLRHTGVDFELVPLASTGDLHPEKVVSRFETKGLFVDTIRQAVLDGAADIAVHSYKDLPTEPCPGLRLGAVPRREDPRDVLVSRAGYALATLPPLSTVGTSSERRRLQLLRAKPSLQVLPLRGNVDTRLRKVAEEELDAVVVAFAGLRRLYVSAEAGGVGTLGLPVTAAPLEPGECLPAPAQGALAIECREDDGRTRALLGAIDDAISRCAVTAERSFLARLGGGCLAPIGALATVSQGNVSVSGMVGDPQRRQLLRLSRTGPASDPERVGRDLADGLVAGGASAILESLAQRRALLERARKA